MNAKRTFLAILALLAACIPALALQTLPCVCAHHKQTVSKANTCHEMPASAHSGMPANGNCADALCVCGDDADVIPERSIAGKIFDQALISSPAMPAVAPVAETVERAAYFASPALSYEPLAVGLVHQRGPPQA